MYALAGFRYFVFNERNGRIQLVIGGLVVVSGIVFRLSRMEWCVLLICIMAVTCLEMVNTSIERVCAMLSAEYHPMIKVIKDVAAAAVLWAAVLSAIIGAIIFLPHIF